MKRYFIVSIFLLLNACELIEVSINDINLSNKSHQFEIAVDCYITTELQNHYIKLSKPANYIENTSLSVVSNALVYISDNENNYYFSETEFLGIYKSNDIFAPQVGVKYNLYVKVGQKEYYATDSIVSVSEIDFLNMQLPQMDNTFNSSTSIFFTGKRHAFGYSENNRWLWLKGSLENYIHPFSYDLRFNFTHTGGEPQGLFPDNSYLYGFQGAITDTITVRKYSVSENYHSFLLALFSETEWKAGIFSTISGNLPTNISQGGTGYFYIMDIDIKKITINELLEFL